MLKRMMSCLIDAGVRSRCFFSWASVSKTVVFSAQSSCTGFFRNVVCSPGHHAMPPMRRQRTNVLRLRMSICPPAGVSRRHVA